MDAVGSLASPGPKRVMRCRFERHRMTIYYRWIANGSPAVYDNRGATSSPVAPCVRSFLMKYDRRLAEEIQALSAHSLRNGRLRHCGKFLWLFGCCRCGERNQTGGGDDSVSHWDGFQISIAYNSPDFDLVSRTVTSFDRTTEQQILRMQPHCSGG